MDKSQNEKDKLYEIACGFQKNYYTGSDCTEESYFIKRVEESYIREYGFETLPELKDELKKMWDEDAVMQECMQTVLVSALKLKPVEGKDGETRNCGEDKSEKLPGYIYNF
ncbi:MAG: hypothetical protein K2O59_06720 [Lachnospiraceae bacterium]|nr:hypothetical protein [Lachnospiraceae bacterium]